jgi:hypothetical protein
VTFAEEEWSGFVAMPWALDARTVSQSWKFWSYLELVSHSFLLNLSSNEALIEDGSNAFILYFATLFGDM